MNDRRPLGAHDLVAPVRPNPVPVPTTVRQGGRGQVLFPDAQGPAAKLRRRAVVVTVLSWAFLILPLLLIGYLTGWWLIPLVILVAQVLSVLFLTSRSFARVKKVVRSENVHPVDPRTQPVLYALLAGVAKQMDLPVPVAYIVEDDQVNAFAAPTSFKSGVMFFTTGWLKIASYEPTRGVVAHEMAHLVNKDGVWSATLNAFHAPLTAAANAANSNTYGRKQPADQVLLVILGVIAFPVRLALRAVTRSRESLADLTAARRLGGAHAVLECLRMLHDLEASSRSVGLHKTSILTRLGRTHPPTRARMNFLKDSCGRQVSIID